MCFIRNFVVLFFSLAPCIVSAGTVPKIIWQASKSLNLSSELEDFVLKIQKTNPNYEYHIVNNDAKDEFMRKEWAGAVADAYFRINPMIGAARADLWRYCVLYKYGGVYLDADSGIGEPLDNIVRENDGLVLMKESNTWNACLKVEGSWTSNIIAPTLDDLRTYTLSWEHVLTNWVIIASPQHPVLLSVIDGIVRTITSYKYISDGPLMMTQVVWLTGPCQLSLMLARHIKALAKTPLNTPISEQELALGGIRFLKNRQHGLSFKRKNAQSFPVDHYSFFRRSFPLILAPDLQPAYTALNSVNYPCANDLCAFRQSHGRLNWNEFDEDLDHFLCMLQNRIPFTFAKFNDGEVIAATQSQGKTDHGWQSLSPLLQFHMRQAMLTNGSHIYKAVPCGGTNDRWFKLMQSIVGQAVYGCDITGAHVFINHNFQRAHSRIVEILQSQKNRRIHVVRSGNESLRLFPFHVAEDIRVPPQEAFPEAYKLVKEILLKKIKRHWVKGDDVIIFMCGPLGRILALEMGALRPESTFIEMGSFWDVDLGKINLIESPGYYHNPKSRNAAKTCKGDLPQKP